MGCRIRVRARAAELIRSGVRVAIDCSMDGAMSDKELKRLAGQLRQAYSANLRSPRPFQLYLTGLARGGRIQQAFRRRCTGFDNYLVQTTEKPHYEYFSPSELVYLSPDSKNVLWSIKKSCVYVLGGIVDETVKKGLTEGKARDVGIDTARLPVKECMRMVTVNPGHVSLPFNQVLDVMQAVYGGEDWGTALASHIPRRKGFAPRQQPLIPWQ